MAQCTDKPCAVSDHLLVLSYWFTW